MYVYNILYSVRWTGRVERCRAAIAVVCTTPTLRWRAPLDASVAVAYSTSNRVFPSLHTHGTGPRKNTTMPCAWCTETVYRL